MKKINITIIIVLILVLVTSCSSTKTVIQPRVYNLGYTTVKESDKTQPLATVDMNGRSGYTNLASYLVGRVAGLQIVNMGGSLKVIIRGMNSLYGDPGALIVVDGMSFDSFDTANSMLNINDIKSVDVIKDGSGYGVRGANGVVVIETYKGTEKR